jgi:Domain of Unknown Function (DUF748)
MKQLAQLVKNRWLLTIASALAVYALVGFLLIPSLVKHYVPGIAAEQLKRQASVAEVRFNPFLFTFEVKDFSFKEADGEPILSLQRLFVDFELKSLVHWAWTFADLRLEGPSLNLVIDQKGKLNLAKIADTLPKSDEPPWPLSNEPLPRLLLEHMALVNGSVKFTDHSRATTATETVSPINLELDAISTLPESHGNYVVSAKFVDGGALEWRGKLSLNPIFSQGEVQLEGFKLATPWNFIRDQLNLAKPAGEIGLTARYRFNYQQGKTDLTINGIAANLAGLRLVASDAANPILIFDKVELIDASFDLASRTMKVPTLAIQNGHVNASINEKGEMNWQKLVKTGTASGTRKPAQQLLAKSVAQVSAGAPVAPWRLKVEAFKVADIGITYTDASRHSPFVVSVGAFGLDLSAKAETGAGSPKVRIDDLSVNLNHITFAERGNKESLVNWDALTIDGGQLDLEKQELTLQQVALKGGGAKILRDANGAIHLAEVFAPKDQGKAPEKTTVTGTNKKDEVKPWHLTLKTFALQGFYLALSDRSVSPEIAYELEDLNIALKDITTDGKTPISFNAGLKVKQGGAASASGKVSPGGDRADAKVQITRINLKPLHSLIGQIAALRLESADLSTQLQVDYCQGKAGRSIKATGGLGVDGLLLNEVKTGKHFLSWKMLNAEGINFDLEPNKLSIKEVRIVEPGTKIEIFKDHTTNVAALFQGKSTVPAGKKSPKTAKLKRGAAKPFLVTVDRLRIDKGIVDFSDLSLVIPFATRIHHFEGAAMDISMAPSSRTTLKFEGRVDDYGQVNVNGSLRPLQYKTFSDIKMVFRNVEMPSLSPYSGTFAGRKIRSGKLNMDLEYKVENSRLKSDNKIVLEQFTLGERIESPNAVSLPLDLAIALLTDSQGKINASVPVEGDLDHPEFGYGKLIWQAIVNLITKAVTAPFRALASVVGGSEEDIGVVLFEPGSDAIPPPEHEKLKKVAQALIQRPKIKLTVLGGYDPKLDGGALRSLQVRRALAQKLDVRLQPGEDPGPVAFSSAKSQRALEELAAERGGRSALDDFQANYEKARGKRVKRIGAISAFLGRASEDQDFYEQLFEHLVDTAPLPEADLKALADRRSKAVVKELTSQSGLDRARVATGKIEPVSEASEGRVPTKLDLGMR